MEAQYIADIRRRRDRLVVYPNVSNFEVYEDALYVIARFSGLFRMVQLEAWGNLKTVNLCDYKVVEQDR